MDYTVAMQRAIALAEKGLGKTAPNPIVGAVIVDSTGAIIAEGFHDRMKSPDHAEVIAINAAGEKAKGSTIVVTLEPCAMCAGAIAQSRISTLVFGAWDEKAGAVGSVWDLLRDSRSLHKVEVRTGVLAEESSKLLQDFFKSHR